MSEQQWPEHISKRKRQEIATHILLGHVVKPHQNQRVREEDRVVKKGLCGHQHKTQKRTAAMFVHDRIPNFPPRRMRPRADTRGPSSTVAGIDDPGRICSHYFSFYLTNDPFRFVIAAVNHQPTRTFWNPAAEENHNEPEHRADAKR